MFLKINIGHILIEYWVFYLLKEEGYLEVIE